MGTPYQKFTDAFLAKVTEFEFLKLGESLSYHVIDGYMRAACAQFSHVCKYNLVLGDDAVREFTEDILAEDLPELQEIVATGMVAQWLQPYVYNAENLLNVLNTKDATVYSPAELLKRVAAVQSAAKTEFVNMMREYSYNHGDLTDLAL